MTARQSKKKACGCKGFSLESTGMIDMGRLRFELRTSRLKAGCSTAELATRPLGMPFWHAWKLSCSLSCQKSLAGGSRQEAPRTKQLKSVRRLLQIQSAAQTSHVCSMQFRIIKSPQKST